MRVVMLRGGWRGVAVVMRVGVGGVRKYEHQLIGRVTLSLLHIFLSR